MQKLSIGKVSQIVDLPQSVLRYWESVFPQLSPEKTEGGTRRYCQQDVDLIYQIKELLYNRKFTINGARSALEKRGQADEGISENFSITEIEKEIDAIIEILSEQGE